MGWIVIEIFLLIAMLVAHGYVVKILWGWFVVPIFKAPPLPLAAAIGIATLVGSLTFDYDLGDPDVVLTHEMLTRAGITNLALIALTLFIGWVAHRFMPKQH